MTDEEIGFSPRSFLLGLYLGIMVAVFVYVFGSFVIWS